MTIDKGDSNNGNTVLLHLVEPREKNSTIVKINNSQTEITADVSRR